jgi:hypothetical protein
MKKSELKDELIYQGPNKKCFNKLGYIVNKDEYGNLTIKVDGVTLTEVPTKDVRFIGQKKARAELETIKNNNNKK